MPWKGEKDPYRIWLSEIILQQTRVEQGRAYYERFLQKFPDIISLSKASEQAVFKLWEGLGYYSRCRNLIHTARFIASEYKGIFPSQYEDIIGLKGVGPYTAAAISSFAFDLPYAVVDGNVYRVLSRFHGDHTPIDRPAGKKIFQQLATYSIDRDRPGAYNQALMDFGATVCKPQSPDCPSCPMRRSCQAYLKGEVNQLPIKSSPKPRRARWFYYLVPEWEGKIPLRQRQGSDVWAGLWELPLLEAEQSLRFDAVRRRMIRQFPANWPKKKDSYQILSMDQTLTHQEIHGVFIRCRLDRKPEWTSDFKWVSERQRRSLSFPRMIQLYWSRSVPDR